MGSRVINASGRVLPEAFFRPNTVLVNTGKVSEEDVLEVAKKIVENKAASPDNKVAVKLVLNMLAEAFTTSPRDGAFSTKWKTQKLIPIPKQANL